MKARHWITIALLVLVAPPAIFLGGAWALSEYAYRTGDYGFLSCSPEKLPPERAVELFKAFLEADEYGLYRFEESRNPNSTRLEIISVEQDDHERWPSFRIGARLIAGRYTDDYWLTGNGCGIEDGVRLMRQHSSETGG